MVRLLDAFSLDDARAFFELDPLRSVRVPPPEPDRPRAVHRLLQPNRFASTAVDDPEPRAPRRRSPAVAAPVASGCSIETLTFRRISRAANRDFTGQGSKWRRNRLSTTTPLERDRSRRELRPAPIGSGTSCRNLAVDRAGVPDRTRVSLPTRERDRLDESNPPK